MEVIRTDFVEFIYMIWIVIMTVFEWSKIAGLFVARLGDMIPNATASLIVHWILLIIVCVGITGGLVASVLILGRKYVCFFRKRQADIISVYVGLFILVVTVLMADIINSILSINLFFVAIGTLIGYTVVRGFIQAKNTEAKKKILKYAGIAVGGVVLFVVMVHFFGAIGIIAIPIGCLFVAGNN